MLRLSPVSPDRAEFQRLAAGSTLVPVFRRLNADLETPVSAFLRVAANEPESFLLESVEGGESIGRYTFIGVKPYRKVVARGASILIEERGRRRRMEGDVFELLKTMLAGHAPARIPGLPPFTAGAIGYFAYDAVRRLERLPEKARDDLRLPDACFMFFDEVLAFDHVRKEIVLMATADLTRNKPQAAYADAVRRLARMERRLANPIAGPAPASARSRFSVDANLSKREFVKAVRAIQRYIQAGDIFPAVFSQRFEVRPGVDPFSIYRALRIVNPSPYLYFLRFGLERTPAAAGKRRGGRTQGEIPTYLIGSSPELLVRVQQRHVEYRPIAGTRPRSTDEAEDLRQERELLGDEKERAEHVMLVDLGRNDVGRVSEFGSVRVKKLMFVERYSHVMHLVSAIEGELKRGLSAVDAFTACFPAGTLSGAPKIRAMEIIEELEPTRRGVYGGSVFYADFSGNLDSCIAIRSMVMQEGRGYIQAGAGIVADSIPIKEYEESVNKAQALIRAIERARAWQADRGRPA